METNDFLVLIGGIMLAIIGYFLRETMSDLKEVKRTTYENTTEVELLKATHKGRLDNLDEKFDMLYESIKELTKAIQELNKKIK
jgi:uncharacterized protein YoxC